MTFGIKITAVAVIAMLILVPSIPDVVEAAPPAGVILPKPAGIILPEGLVIDNPGRDEHSTSFGTFTTASGKKKVEIRCYDHKKEKIFYNQKKSTGHTNSQFFLSCTRYKPTKKELPSMRIIGCPFTKYKGIDEKVCYITETFRSKMPLVTHNTNVLNRNKSLRDNIVEQLFKAHRVAFKMGWYLTWSRSKYFVNKYDAKGMHIFINSGLYRNNRDFALDSSNRQGIIRPINKNQKTKDHMKYVADFLNDFYTTYAQRGEDVKALVYNAIKRVRAVAPMPEYTPKPEA